MGLIPWEKRDSVTRRFPNTVPNAGLANATLDQVCTAYPALINFRRGLWRTLGYPGVADFLAVDTWVIGQICPSPPGQVPALPPIGLFTQGCRSSGIIRGRVNVGFANNPVWVEYEETWDCTSNNVGLPIAGPFWKQSSGDFYAWFMTVSRGDGTPPYDYRVSADSANPDPSFVEMRQITFTPCPGCNAGVGKVLPPTLPPLPPSAPTPTRPSITIPVTFRPQLSGSTAITVNVPFTPRFGFELNVNRPIIQLSPDLSLRPEFTFAPTIELNADGVVFDFGGVNIPINNEFNLINNASDSEFNCEQLRECIEDLFDDEKCAGYTQTTIASGTSSITQSVFNYSFPPDEYDMVTCTITGTLPPNLDYRQTNQPTGFFGGLAFTYQGCHYENTMIYSRDSAAARQGRRADGCRLFLKPGIQFTLRGYKCNE